jgi:hypothetical protein
MTQGPAIKINIKPGVVIKEVEVIAPKEPDNSSNNVLINKYEELNERCEIVLTKIKKRKVKKAEKNGK